MGLENDDGDKRAKRLAQSVATAFDGRRGSVFAPKIRSKTRSRTRGSDVCVCVCVFGFVFSCSRTEYGRRTTDDSNTVARGTRKIYRYANRRPAAEVPLDLLRRPHCLTMCILCCLCAYTAVARPGRTGNSVAHKRACLTFFGAARIPVGQTLCEVDNVSRTKSRSGL